MRTDPQSMPPGERWTARILPAGIALALAVQLALAIRMNIGWDEFYYLGKVHGYLRGELTGPLQALQVHLFWWWLPAVGDEMDQLVAARVVQWVWVALSSLLIYRIARRFTGRTEALFAPMAWLAISYVVWQGTSFRADPIVTVLGLGAIDAALGRRAWGQALAGLLLAAALLVTIKAAMLVLLVVGLLLVERWDGRWGPVRPLAVLAVSFVAAFAGLYLVQAASLPAPDPGRTEAFVEGSARKTLLDAGLFPRWPTSLGTLILSPLSWVLIGAGLVVAARGLRREPRRALMILGLAAPLLSIAVYRNAFPYFYVLIAAPAAVAAAMAAERLVAQGRRAWLGPAVAAVLAAMPVLLAWHHFARDGQASQRELVALVHELFPEPVPYIDRCSMIAAFPKVGWFMTAWGLERYRDAGESVFRALIEGHAPRFLIANVPALELGRDAEEMAALGRYRLFAEDLATLRANYVHHWGALYVAGKTVSLEEAGAEERFEMLIPGTYTIEAEGPVVLDGAVLAPGSKRVVNLGWHSIASASGPQRVVLRWGADLPRPDHPPHGPLFTGL